MISLIFIILFIFCLAMAIGAILIVHQEITTYNTEFHKNYFYYLVSFFAFGIYGIWGQIIIRVVLSSMETSVKVIETVANFLPVLGVPFVIISWLMLVNMAFSMFSTNRKPIWGLLHVGLFTLLIGCSWIVYDVLKETPDFINRYLTYFEAGVIIGFETVYFTAFILIALLLSKSKEQASRNYLVRFSWILVFAFLVRSMLIPFAPYNLWMLAIWIFIYFSSNLVPLFYLRINADQIFEPVKAEHTSEEKIEYILRKYRITKREREIIRQICQGKSNQQIADELFISLQTVKDHTHRIYSKIGIRSRMQLVQKVSG